VFIKAKDDGVGGDNWTTGAISCAKLQSNHHHQQTNIFNYVYDYIIVICHHLHLLVETAVSVAIWQKMYELRSLWSLIRSAVD